ncbi:hypothetical protein OsI_30444 [Oryza sativa Indica Group]|uniref:DUF4216 domain-containing protein n=1 Tax=Oryza sativa subsp. indica TaxID=39946 RepID=B8BD13_ORYSI|nr:hypothetical protein OsI_30444 [Oryza sativa Indica Group]
MSSEQVSDEVQILAKGPLLFAKKYNSYAIYGYNFHTKAYDEGRSVQSSGVAIVAETSCYIGNNESPMIRKKTYYGIITEIIELDYFRKGNIVLFKCDWVDNQVEDKWVKVDKFGIVNVNFKHLFNTGEKLADEPFILASQAIQCVYEMDEWLENYSLATAAKKWKDYKADLKKAHFNETKTEEELIAACDKRVLPEHWEWLVHHWLSPEAQARSLRGKMNRGKFVEHGYKPRRDEMYIKTHTRKNGTPLTQAAESIVNQQVSDQELSSHAYRQKVDQQVSDHEVSNHAYRQQRNKKKPNPSPLPPNPAGLRGAGFVTVVGHFTAPTVVRRCRRLIHTGTGRRRRIHAVVASPLDPCRDGPPMWIDARSRRRCRIDAVVVPQGRAGKSMATTEGGRGGRSARGRAADVGSM